MLLDAARRQQPARRALEPQTGLLQAGMLTKEFRHREEKFQRFSKDFDIHGSNYEYHVCNEAGEQVRDSILLLVKN